MTDVLFISPTTKLRLSHESNGTMILATLLRQAGISTSILRYGQFESYDRDYSLFLKEITEKIISINPRCVSFYTLWPFYHMVLRIASDLKAICPQIPIVFGGPQASATAEATIKAAPYVDYVCSGEGELTVVPFFQALLNGNTEEIFNIPGVCGSRNGSIVRNPDPAPLCDLNTLPYWDEELYIHDYRESPETMSAPDYFMPIDAGRGCPYGCTFCSSSRFLKRTYRLKSADRIIADIRYYKERYGITSFRFSHDALTANMKLVEAICDRLIEEDLQIRWNCTSRIDRLTEPLVKKMKQAGLVLIEVGVETGSQDMQYRINKKLDLEKVLHMIDFLQSEKIGITPFFMYGFPDETEEDLAQTLTFQLNLLDKGISNTSMSYCKFNPNTVITDTYFDQLKLDSSCKITARGLPMGYYDELPIISEHKELFPFFYHLDTPVRNNYQYLTCLSYLYNNYRHSCRFIRSLFEGDDLLFYREFCEANADVFLKDMKQIERAVTGQSQLLLSRLVDRCAPPSCAEPLKAILQFEADKLHLSKEKTGTELQKTYDFLFAEYLLKVPAVKLSKGRSELLLRKQNGKIAQKLLSMN